MYGHTVCSKCANQTSTQPKTEWQRLCSQLRQSKASEQRLREIAVQASQRNPDPNAHLTLEGLAGLSKRRLCRLIVMQHMRDERTQVQGIQRLIQRQRERLATRFPEPEGVCSNLTSNMDIAGDPVYHNIDLMCGMLGKTKELLKFMYANWDTNYQQFAEKVANTERLTQLRRQVDYYSDRGESVPAEIETELDTLSNQLGPFEDQCKNFIINANELVPPQSNLRMLNPIYLMLPELIVKKL